MRAKMTIPWMVIAALSLGGAALAKDDCPKPDKKATPTEVFEARIAAMQRGDLQAIACSYAEDAVVIFPGSVIRGREAIMEAFAAFGGMFGGAAPTVTSMTEADDVLFITYELSAPGIAVPDGSDTFVIRKGQVQYQAVHARIVFTEQ